MNHTKACLTALDTVHNTYFRSVFGWNQSVAKAAIWGESGVLPPKAQIAQRKLNYLKYLINLPEQRVVKKVFLQQCLWERTNDPCYKNSWWQCVQELLNGVNLRPYELMHEMINIKSIIRRKFIESFNIEKTRKITLRYYDKLKPMPDKNISNVNFSNFWLKAKIGGLFLNERTIKVCLLCGAELETVEHFLFECNTLFTQITLPTEVVDLSPAEKCGFIFSTDRNLIERKVIGKNIFNRWNERLQFETAL